MKLFKTLSTNRLCRDETTRVLRYVRETELQEPARCLINYGPVPYGRRHVLSSRTRAI
jgi:hypothetical protein